MTTNALALEPIPDPVRFPGAGVLFNLVDRIQREPPYSYRADEVPPASQWFAATVGSATVALMATESETPVGYCVGLPLPRYGGLGRELVERLDVDPATTMYLAELGVDSRFRRRQVASRLVDEFHRRLDEGTTGCIVRTVAGNDAAIRLYTGHGYELLSDVSQEWHGRTRVFLRWRRR